MLESRMPPIDEGSNPKPRKKKPLTQASAVVQAKGDTKEQEMSHLSTKSQKRLKRSLKNEVSTSFQQTERSAPGTLPDSSMSSDYRTLRHKYLLLEEESGELDKELSVVGADTKTLEDEKFALLDQLVVLEGLVDPSEIRPEGGS